MKSIRVERLRCLTDTGDIAIKPVTVLLGQNSSGKSTFLRVFPLLKQSIESRTTGPILWNGRLVDFGSYDDAHQSSSTDDILLHFNFQIKIKKERQTTEIFYMTNFPQNLDSLDIKLTLKIIKDRNQQTTKTKEIILYFRDSEIKIEFGEKNTISAFSVNFFDVLTTNSQYIFRQSDNYLLPTIYELDPKKEVDLQSLLFQYILVSSRNSLFLTLAKTLYDHTKNLSHHFSSPKTIINMLCSFRIGDSQFMLNDIQNNKFAGKQWKNNTDEWTTETAEFQKIRDLIIASSVPLILEECNQLITNLTTKIRYIGPVRATAQRYYIIQDLAIDEIDCQGQNLAMFLLNLTASEKQDLEEWTFKYFKFKLSLEASLGHISLKICSEDSQEKINVADTGFGYSQILPVIIQLWLLSSALPKRERRRNRRDSAPVIFAIEQPELHLHPRLQGVLTDAFVNSIKAAKDNNIELRLVIETHSEVLVNRLGDLVSNGTIAPEDINIVLFEPSDEPNKVNVKTAEFDSEGYLLNWPLGFFDRDS